MAKVYLQMFPNFNEYTREEDVNRQAFNSTNNHSQYFLGVISQKNILDTNIYIWIINPFAVNLGNNNLKLK